MIRLHKCTILQTLILFVLFLFYRYNLSTNSTIDVYSNDVYEQLLDIHHFKFLTNPQQVCEECQNGFLVIVTVISNVINFDLRSEIRRTWDKNINCRRIVFMLGASKDNATNIEVLRENDKYGDIVQGSFIDSYRNMTYKHLMDLKWITHHCKRAKNVVKIDDDFKNIVLFPNVVPNLQKLYNFLKNGMWARTGLLACKVNKGFEVRRKGKYAVSQEEYPGTVYPDYCAGFLVIYSVDVVRRLLEESREVPFFRIEDVHVTGTLANRIGIKHVNVDPMYFMNNSVIDLLFKGLDMPPVAEPNEIYKYWKRNHFLD